MALNLTDSAEIMAAYDSVLNNELNWFLLHYPNNTVDELALYAFGVDGLEELKTKIDPSNPEQVLVGFLRADDVAPGDEESEEDSVKYVLISYVPKGVLGVRRARAQVHTRRLGMIFKKHDAVLTVDDYSQLTNTAIAHSLAEPDPSLLTFSASPLPGVAGPMPISTSPPTAGTVIYTASPSGSPTRQQHPSFAATDMGRSFSQPMANHTSTMINKPQTAPTSYMDLKPVKRSFSETDSPQPHRYSTTGVSPPSGHIRLGSNMFSHFLRRKKRSTSAAAAMGRGGDIDESQESEDSMPPPTPPKDKGVYATMLLPTSEKRSEEKEKDEEGVFAHHAPGVAEHGEFTDNFAHTHIHGHESLPHVLPKISESSFRHSHSVSEFAVVSHEEIGGRPSVGEADVVVIHPEEFGLYKDKDLPAPGQQRKCGIDSLKKGKWAEPRGLSAIRDPGERARLRIELQRQKDDEEREALRAEEERQERLRREKREIMRREEEEAERRKAAIQAEALRVAAERRRREEEEQQEEERKAIEREQRKRMERQRRMEEHLRLEEWRKEQQRIAEKTLRAEEEAKRREEEERREKILKAEDAVKQKAKEGAMTGWVTIQTDDSMVWRRRYYKFAPNTFYFYRNPKELTQVVDRLDVRGAVKGLKEPKDGYEDLEAIPFSFAVEFKDRGPWSMFADSEEEKFKLLGLLQFGAGLDE